MKKNYPKIITADKRNKDHVKAVLKLGFSSDALLRWVFPDANSFLKNFDLWMDEFSKKSFCSHVKFPTESYFCFRLAKCSISSNCISARFSINQSVRLALTLIAPHHQTSFRNLN